VVKRLIALAVLSCFVAALGLGCGGGPTRPATSPGKVFPPPGVPGGPATGQTGDTGKSAP